MACAGRREEAAQLLFLARVSGQDGPNAWAEECTPCAADPSLQPAGSEQLGPVTRSSILQSEPPEQPPSIQQQLDAAVGPGIGKCVVDEANAVAACLRCPRFKRSTISLLNHAWLANAKAHMSTHPIVSTMNTLDRLLVSAAARHAFAMQSQLQYSPTSPPSVTAIGSLWLNTMGRGMIESLLREDWRNGKEWGVDTRFKADGRRLRRVSSGPTIDLLIEDLDAQVLALLSSAQPTDQSELSKTAYLQMLLRRHHPAAHNVMAHRGTR